MLLAAKPRTTRWNIVLAKFTSKINRLGGGEKGIRTLETVTRLHTFQACAFDHSAISPRRADAGLLPTTLRPLPATRIEGAEHPSKGARNILMDAGTARAAARGL